MLMTCIEVSLIGVDDVHRGVRMRQNTTLGGREAARTVLNMSATMTRIIGVEQATTICASSVTPL